MGTGFDSSERCARHLDLDDPLHGYREEFSVPEDGIYLAGNSLGLQSKAARESLMRVLEEWKDLGVNGWLDADQPWFFFAERLGELGAKLVGARPDEVVATGTTTINIHTLISSFYDPKGRRTKILADELNFPTDLYALQGQMKLRGRDPERDLVMIPSADGRTLDEDAIVEAMGDDVALVFLPSVLYCSGQRLDIARLAKAAHERGIIIGLDCSHSVGVMSHDFAEWDIDFAVWCSYKYLNGGPGSAAFLYVNDRHRNREPLLAGWFGYLKERQFDMRLDFQPQPGARGWQISSPGILGAAPLEGALSVILDAGIEGIEAKSRTATSYLMYLVDELLAAPPYSFSVSTPREVHRRGGHVALSRSSDAHAITRALKSRGVIPDFRHPDVIRLTPSPLYTTYRELWQTVQHIRHIIDQREYEQFEDGPPIIP